MNNTVYSPEELLDQWQAFNSKWLSVAQLIQTLPQIDELPLGAGRHGHSTQIHALHIHNDSHDNNQLNAYFTETV